MPENELVTQKSSACGVERVGPGIPPTVCERNCTHVDIDSSFCTLGRISMDAKASISIHDVVRARGLLRIMVDQGHLAMDWFVNTTVP